ncbi:MAG: membrane protein insertion efficiency factor YidD [Burkholderiaceae bacterium]
MPARALRGAVRVYQLLFSAWLGSSCRYAPSWSAYALQALDAHGAAAGSYLTLHRLARCHPWCAGGDDPVPSAPPRLFGRWATTTRRAGETSGAASFDKTVP